jgi:hypothetical protein
VVENKNPETYSMVPLHCKIDDGRSSNSVARRVSSLMTSGTTDARRLDTLLGRPARPASRRSGHF